MTCNEQTENEKLVDAALRLEEVIAKMQDAKGLLDAASGLLEGYDNLMNAVAIARQNLHEAHVWCKGLIETLEAIRDNF